ncbi:hypothetical protein [Dokdonella ginsengisoli]|uniref:DUF3987 domain-containing protein n=1 Tax=Dokdonella ginsengisoli TaxID=363846 RepID=A0ABV9QQC0_9GAMM
MNSTHLASASATNASHVLASPLPDGHYTVAINDVGHYTQDAGVHVLDIEFRVIEGEHLGRAFFETIPLDRNSRDPLRGPWYTLWRIARAINVPTWDTISPTDDPIGQLAAGNPCQATIKTGQPTTYEPTVASHRYPPAPPAASALVASAEPVERKIPSLDRLPDFTTAPPGILGDIARWVTETSHRPQPLLSPLAALSFCAAALGNLWRGPTGLSSNLYLTIVGPSGGGKDHVLRAPRLLLQACELDGLCGGSDIASGAGLIARIVDSPNTVYALDEWGHYLAAMADPRFGGHHREVAKYLLQLSGRLHPVFGGKDYAQRTDASKKTARFPCVNLLGATTPSTYYDALTLGQVRDGFLGRMIVVEAAGVPAKIKRPMSDAVPSKFVEWAAAIRSAAHASPRNLSLAGCIPSAPRVVNFTDARAEAILDEFDDYADSERVRLAADGDGFDNLVVRWHEQALKLALVAAAALDPIEPKITQAAAQWSCDFVKFHGARSVCTVRERVTGSEFERKVRDCMMALRAAGRGGYTLTTMCRRSQAFRRLNPKERIEILNHLQDIGEARQQPSATERTMTWYAAEFAPPPP